MEKGINAPGATPGRRRAGGGWLLKCLTGAAIIFIAGLFSWKYLVCLVSQIQFMDHREVVRTAPLEGLLFKEEKVIKSTAAGRLHFVSADGRRLEVGALAARVTVAEQDAGPNRVNIYTPWAGIFCSHLDGLENVLSPDNLDVLELPRIERIVDKPLAEGGRVEKGQPVFKIVDNLSPVFIHASISKDDFPAGLMDRPGWLQAAWEEQPLRLKPVKLLDKEGGWEGFFLIQGYPEQLVHHRKVRFSVTAEKLSGILVPARAVVYRQDQPGLYLVVKKKAQWAPVKIDGELNGLVAVSGRGISEGARYVSNPALARDGRPVE